MLPHLTSTQLSSHAHLALVCIIYPNPHKLPYSTKISEERLWPMQGQSWL